MNKHVLLQISFTIKKNSKISKYRENMEVKRWCCFKSLKRKTVKISKIHLAINIFRRIRCKTFLQESLRVMGK